ncbi:MAG: YqeG family HAD IIIA-type phosphatase [Bacillota bacterium]
MRYLARWFCPHEYLSSPQEVDFQSLRSRGVRGLIVDLDNTLVHWNQYVAGPELQLWFEQARAADLAVCILSNNHHVQRIAGFAHSLEADFLARAGKPRRRPFKAAMDLMGTTPETTAVIGDQVFTDVLGGRRSGLYTILVRPRSEREFVGTRCMRVIERHILRYLVKVGLVTAPRP